MTANADTTPAADGTTAETLLAIADSILDAIEPLLALARTVRDAGEALLPDAKSQRAG